MKTWCVVTGAILTGYYVALKFHWAISGKWAMCAHGANDPTACIVWLVTTSALIWLWLYLSD